MGVPRKLRNNDPWGRARAARGKYFVTFSKILRIFRSTSINRVLRAEHRICAKTRCHVCSHGSNTILFDFPSVSCTVDTFSRFQEIMRAKGEIHDSLRVTKRQRLARMCVYLKRDTRARATNIKSEYSS